MSSNTPQDLAALVAGSTVDAAAPDANDQAGADGVEEITASLARLNQPVHNIDFLVLRNGGQGRFNRDLVATYTNAITRYIELFHVGTDDFEQDAQAGGTFGNIKNSPEFLKAVGVKKLIEQGRIVIRFESLSDSVLAWHTLLRLKRFSTELYTWGFRHIHPAVYANSAPVSYGPLRSTDEGEIHLVCFINTDELETPLRECLGRIRDAIDRLFLRRFGRVNAIEFLSYENKRLDVRLEFDSIIAADKCAIVVQELQLQVHMTPVFFGNILQLTDVVHITMWAFHWSDDQHPETFIDDEPPYHPACGESDELYHPDGNAVDVTRIVQGLDVRTTVMLRNIPNKMGFFELFRLLYRTCYGAFDFMYLRVDFANQCNVGYAFINFIEPQGINLLVNAVLDRRWTYCGSGKVASISYATIQDTAALIERFQNSGVQQQWAPHRAKLTAIPGYRRGPWELPFPIANNPSKLRRSLQNTHSIGLFGPNRNGPQTTTTAGPSRGRQAPGNGVNP